MRVHLVDGTYELFRFFYGAPSYKNAQGKEVGAVRMLLRSHLVWLQGGQVTHVAALLATGGEEKQPGKQ